MMEGLPHQLASFKHAVLMLPIAALLSGALGVLRPIRTSLVPRSSHVIQTQILLAVVGTAVMIIVYVGNTRRFLLRRFPFFVVYRVFSQRVEVVAVAHARRKPHYWLQR